MKKVLFTLVLLSSYVVLVRCNRQILLKPKKLKSMVISDSTVTLTTT